MGHRATYVLYDGTSTEIYYSHWGAKAIPEVLICGPDYTIRHVRSLEPDDDLLNDTWAEGGILLDLVNKALLFWGGENILYFSHLRRLLLRLLHIEWNGWTVAWARHGVADFANYFGRDPAPLLSSGDDTGIDYPASLEKLCAAATRPDGYTSILTVKSENGQIADYGFRFLMIGCVLGHGPHLFSYLPELESVDLPREDTDYLSGGAYLDVGTQTMWVWTNGTIDPQFIRKVQQRWPEWTVHDHVDGLARQVALSGRDPATIMVPLDQAAADLVAELTQSRAFDPSAALKVMLRSWPSGDVQRVEIDPHFLTRDPEAMTAEERMSILTPILHSILQQPEPWLD